MALHNYFQDQAKRDVFEAAFKDWYDKTREQLAELAKDPEEFAWKGNERIERLAKLMHRINAEETLIEDPLSSVLDSREKVSNSVARTQRDIEKYYGENNGYISLNTVLRLNSLPIKDQAALYVNFNEIVSQLSVDAPEIISLAQERERRRALIGPEMPADVGHERTAALG